MPNPASVYCEQNGGKLDIRVDASGGQAGVCVFPDGSECDEWAYFRGECKPSDVPAKPEEVVNDGWKTYTNETLGYSFQYPADAVISTADDPLKTVMITGSVVGSDNWPVFSIAHPGDREEYRPPEGTDLAQWLTDHNLMADGRQPDIEIAGTTAIHFRQERSPQSYASDSYYFAKSGQLYQIRILHAGDKEDWNVYNHFLQSIQFK